MHAPSPPLLLLLLRHIAPPQVHLHLRSPERRGEKGIATEKSAEDKVGVEIVLCAAAAVVEGPGLAGLAGAHSVGRGSGSVRALAAKPNHVHNNELMHIIMNMNVHASSKKIFSFHDYRRNRVH